MYAHTSPRMIALTGLLCLALLAPAAHADTVKRTFDVASGGTLEVDTDQGSVHITTAPGSQVRITVLREARSGDDEDFELRFDQRGNDVIVEGERPGSGWSWNKRFKIRFDIVVPEQYDLEIETAGGSISVADLQGDVNCHTSGGSIDVDDIEGRVDCRTSGGSIDIGRVDGTVMAKTSGGSISIDRSGGSVVAKTSGGNITVNEVLGSIDATTSGGSVRATISSQPQADCRLSTSGGKVDVQLADSVAVDLDARTSGGRVHVDVPVMVQGTVGRSSLQGEVNGGGPQLHLRTSGGSIHVRRR